MLYLILTRGDGDDTWQIQKVTETQEIAQAFIDTQLGGFIPHFAIAAMTGEIVARIDNVMAQAEAAPDSTPSV